jgi:hypothetical protein
MNVDVTRLRDRYVPDNRTDVTGKAVEERSSDQSWIGADRELEMKAIGPAGMVVCREDRGRRR